MPEISVIVPVYNVEKYLSQCLDSILAQTFCDIEIICVNDGAKDNSRKILEEYKKKDKRIIVIDKQNGGLSSARNTGLKYAKGNFISFIDSDDWISSDMLEKLYNNITGLNTDISMCGVNVFDENTKKIKEDGYFNFSVFPLWFDYNVFSYIDTKPFTMEVPVMAWNKLYRHSFLEACNAQFPERKIFEDGAFFFSVYFKTKRVSLIREPLYYYRINRKSSILNNNDEKFLDIIDIVNLMFEELKKSDIFEDVKYDFYKHKADDIIYRYKTIKKPFKRSFAKKFKKDSCLLNEKYFDLAKVNNDNPVTYKCLCEIKNNTSILAKYRYKFIKRFMRKIIQVLETDKNIYYFKFWSLKIKLKKKPEFFEINYKNDKIFVCIFRVIKFSIKFEYSKL